MKNTVKFIPKEILREKQKQIFEDPILQFLHRQQENILKYNSVSRMVLRFDGEFEIKYTPEIEFKLSEIDKQIKERIDKIITS